MQNIIIKTPIGKEHSLVMYLTDVLGIEASTDAYYDDPDNFVSVIVRLPTIQELQKIASKCGAEVLDKPPCFGNLQAVAYEREDHGCATCDFQDRCNREVEKQL